MDLIKVDGHSGLARDKKTGAILNINSTEIDRIKELTTRIRGNLKSPKRKRSTSLKVMYPRSR
jgi:hypothetical protein